jgi:hypothetical protein
MGYLVSNFSLSASRRSTYEIKIIDLDSATYNQSGWIALASGVVCVGY